MINTAHKEQRETLRIVTFHLAENPNIQNPDIFIQHLNIPEADITNVDHENNSLLHIITKAGKTAFVEPLLERKVNLDLRNSQGNTALHLSAEANNSEITLMLLKAGADSILENNDNLLALEMTNNSDLRVILSQQLNRLFLKSVELNNVGSILYCLIKGADINFYDKKNYNNGLHIAAINNFTEVFHLLLEEKINVNARNKDGVAPIHIIAGNINEYLLKILIEARNDLDFNIVDKYGNTAMHYAIKDQTSSTFIMLLLNHGASPFIKASTDFSILYKCTFLGFENVVNHILSQDIQIINEQNNPYNFSALHASVLNNQISMTWLLVHQGIDITLKGNRDLTAYDLVKEYNDNEIADYLNLKCIKLISAAANNRLDLVKALIPKVKINAAERLGATALDMSVKFDHLEIATLLLNSGAKIKADKAGDTALHLAASMDNCAMMDLLMSYGADICAPNLMGIAAFELSVLCSFQDKIMECSFV